MSEAGRFAPLARRSQCDAFGRSISSQEDNGKSLNEPLFFWGRLNDNRTKKPTRLLKNAWRGAVTSLRSGRAIKLLRAPCAFPAPRRGELLVEMARSIMIAALGPSRFPDEVQPMTVGKRRNSVDIHSIR
jgi:hypothetical protein